MHMHAHKNLPVCVRERQRETPVCYIPRPQMSTNDVDFMLPVYGATRSQVGKRAPNIATVGEEEGRGKKRRRREREGREREGGESRRRRDRRGRRRERRSRDWETGSD